MWVHWIKEGLATADASSPFQSRTHSKRRFGFSSAWSSPQRAFNETTSLQRLWWFAPTLHIRRWVAATTHSALLQFYKSPIAVQKLRSRILQCPKNSTIQPARKSKNSDPSIFTSRTTQLQTCLCYKVFANQDTGIRHDGKPNLDRHGTRVDVVLKQADGYGFLRNQTYPFRHAACIRERHWSTLELLSVAK